MKKVLLIQTGGTIAMQAQLDGVVLDPDHWSDQLYKQTPTLNEIADIDVEPLFFEDSSDLHPYHWDLLLRLIQNKYNKYDGFVILHGTDTMAYTASALSFGIESLDKPIILTGSQVPLSRIRSDAQRNMINSVEIATSDLPEVAICFNDHVYRGNRATKMSIGDFDAFATPNYPTLADIDLNIDFHRNNWRSVAHGKSNKATSFYTGFSGNIFVLTIHPGFQTNQLESILLENIDALLIRAYGSGNFPIKDHYSWIPFLRRCKEKNIITVITSQANHDAVNLKNYAAGRIGLDLGVLSSADMTLEACVTKLMWLISAYQDNDESNLQIAQRFQENLRGERS